MDVVTGSSTPKIAIIIPAFNRLQNSIWCINACTQLNYPNYSIYFVDGGSTDKTSQVIPKRFSNIHYIGTVNLWWTKSINLGISHALMDGCEFLLLLNQDVVLAHDYLDRLVGAFRSSGRGLYGGVVYYQNELERIWAAGGYIHKLKGTAYYCHTCRADEVEMHSLIREVDWLPGMGTLIHRDIYDDLGPLEGERLPHYFSDAEYCLRAKKKGIPVRLVWEASLWHDVGEYDAYVRERHQTIREFAQRFFSIKSFMDFKTNWVFYRLVYGKIYGMIYFIPHMIYFMAVAVRDFFRVNFRR